MTGSFGLLGVFSFNGNKTITCGAGGIIVTNDKKLAEKAKAHNNPIKGFSQMGDFITIKLVIIIDAQI